MPPVSSSPKAPPIMHNPSVVQVTTTNNSPVQTPQQPIMQSTHTQAQSPSKEQVSLFAFLNITLEIGRPF